MDYKVRKIINSLAEEIIDIYKIEIPIDNIEKIVKSIGGRVIEDDSNSGAYDGRITRKNLNDEDCKFLIFVPENQILERKNFTIAHELGHLFLHMGYKIDEKLWKAQEQVDYYRKGSSEEEFQANEFAAAFLMPKKEYIEQINKYTEGELVDINSVAKYFNVSRQAASNRGKWLGYLEW